MHYDLRLKLIFQEAMPGLLRVLHLPAIKEYLSVEFPKRGRAMPDLVVLLVDGRILHIELQSKNDPRIEWRCLEYWQVISEKWPDAEVVQVVVYLGDSPLTMKSEIKRGRLQYAFSILNLQDIQAAAFLASESDSERILAALCQTDDPAATIAAILASWKHLSAKEIRENIGNLLVLSQLKKRDTIVRKESASMPIEIDITENVVFQEGAKFGEARGEARGEVRGKMMGEAMLLTRLLERRFGTLPEPLRRRLSMADSQTLEHWADRLDSAATLQELFD